MLLNFEHFIMYLYDCHDIQHNDIQHNDTENNDTA
jgi:hypothetical protein